MYCSGILIYVDNVVVLRDVRLNNTYSFAECVDLCGLSFVVKSNSLNSCIIASLSEQKILMYCTCVHFLYRTGFSVCMLCCVFQ